MTMTKTTLIESATWACPRCHTNNIVCIEHAEEGDCVKCGTCAVYFRRLGWTYRFVSADNRRIFIPEATFGVFNAFTEPYQD